MRKRKEKSKNDDTLIDLSDRKDIKIIPAKKKKKRTYNSEMKEFEYRSSSRYSTFNDFTNLCIQKNIANSTPIPKDIFDIYMKKLLENNELLEDMINLNLMLNKEQDN